MSENLKIFKLAVLRFTFSRIRVPVVLRTATPTTALYVHMHGPPTARSDYVAHSAADLSADAAAVGEAAEVCLDGQVKEEVRRIDRHRVGKTMRTIHYTQQRSEKNSRRKSSTSGYGSRTASTED